MKRYAFGSKPECSPKLLICTLSITILCLLGGWLLLISAQASSPADYDIQGELSGALLRLHIIANSDSAADQTVKLQIRDAITKAFQDDFSAAADKDTACALAEKLLPEAEAIANQVLEEQGFSERASASLTFCYFPEKTYGDMTFPAGYYDALRITIGEANGQNWWCVLYPPLCFTDVSTSVPEASKVLLQNNLSVRAYESLTPSADTKTHTQNSASETAASTDTEKTEADTPVIRFRFLTFLNDLFS